MRAPRGRSSERGIIVVVVLWMMAALAALATIYSVYVRNMGAASQLGVDGLRAEAAIEAAIELSVYQLTSATAAPSAVGAFEARVGATKVAVKYESEGARVDLNLAPKELLAGLFVSIGVDADRAGAYADRVIGWRSKGEGAGPKDEAASYRTAALGYPPRQAPFADVLELRLVRDIPEDVVTRILPYVTVFNGRADVDVTIALPPVLAAIPRMNSARPHDAPDQGAPAPPNAGGSPDAQGTAGNGANAAPRKAFRLLIDVQPPNGRRVSAVVVVLLLDDSEEPYRVLSWNDDFEAPLR